MFVGHPTVRLVAMGTLDEKFAGKIPLEQVPPEKRQEFACVIVKRGNKYFWKSRDGYEVTQHRVGSYIEFRRLDRSDYVRVANKGLRDNVFGGIFNKDSNHHYVEHLTRGLISVNYWGRAIYDAPKLFD